MAPSWEEELERCENELGALVLAATRRQRRKVREEREKKEQAEAAARSAEERELARLLLTQKEAAHRAPAGPRSGMSDSDNKSMDVSAGSDAVLRVEVPVRVEVEVPVKVPVVPPQVIHIVRGVTSLWGKVRQAQFDSVDSSVTGKKSVSTWMLEGEFV